MLNLAGEVKPGFWVRYAKAMKFMDANADVKTLSNFRILYEMVKKAVDPTKPTLVRTHPKNRENLDVQFLELCHDWNIFKADQALSEDEFNKVEDDIPKVQYNDNWMER